jgi:hypothetical protein
MKPLHLPARRLAERFAGERLDRIAYVESLKQPVQELREAALNWIEHHTERKLGARALLENP